MTYQGNLNFEEFGQQGPTLILLHGWAHSIENQRGLAEILAWRYKVYALDLPGFGKSDLPPDSWGTAQYAECVKNFMQDQNIIKASILGHSFGGRVAIQFAAKFPEMVDKLILMNSSGLPLERSFKDNLRHKSLKYGAKFLKQLDRVFGSSLFANQFVPRFASADYATSGDLRKIFVRTVNEDLTREARSIQAETLLLWGDKDFETPIQFAHRFRRLISNSSLTLLAGKGHEPFADVGSHLCAKHIFSFMDENSK